MPTPPATISWKRRVAGAAAMIATGGGLAAMAVHDTHWIEWSLLAFSGMVAAAGVGLARTSLVGQVLSRATAWIVLVPSALVTAFTLAGSHSPDLAATALTVGSGGALLLARPMLHTAKARADFDPTSYRSWLFASATASAFGGILTGMLALDSFRWAGFGAMPVAVTALALAMLASAVGVVRMRGWGLLLGAATSAVTLLAALALHDVSSLAVAMAAVPGMMMALPILLASRSRAKSSRATAISAAAASAGASIGATASAASAAYASARLRIDDAAASHLGAAHVRVASDGVDADASWDDSGEHETAHGDDAAHARVASARVA